MILNFSFVFDSLNASVQPGDLAYYIPTTTQGAFDMGDSDQAIVFGEVVSISTPSSTPGGGWGVPGVPTLPTFIGECTIAWDDAGGIPFPSPTDYIMFSKSSNVNVASLIGYYAEVSLVNDSHEYVELYSVGSQVSENSK
tara:strand:+ start:628 stop:1047 length:420 start_codon:yes stop_codon:yes gene_type:complete